MNNGASFDYLNQELAWRWPGFTTTNLEKRPDGRLTLARVPRVVEEPAAGPNPARRPPAPAMPLCPPPDSAVPPVPDPSPAGIATTGDCACDLYISDPVGQRIWHYDACVGEPVALPYLQGPGPWPGQVNGPRGLAIADAPGGMRLYIADSGNHRIQVIAPATGQPLAVWGQAEPYAPPEPGAEPGQLNDPWALAADKDGNIYVVDHGNARLQKFTPAGQVVPAFWDTVLASGNAPLDPIGIAIAPYRGGERLYALDRGGGRPQVCVFDTTGAARGVRGWNVDVTPAPVAVAANRDAVYVGAADGTVVKFRPNGQRMSVLPGTGGPLAALAVGCDGELLLGGGGLPVTRLRLDAGYTPAGHFQVGPFPTLARALAWHRWRVEADPLDTTAHVQLFTYSSTQPDPPPNAAGDNPFDAPGWYAQPRDELDVLILSTPVRDALRAGPPADPSADRDEGPLEPAYFWLGGLLRGDGTTSPVLRQMRVDYTPDTAIRHLPALYREGARRRLFLDLVLAALGGELGRVEETLAALPARFDPAAAPADWLPWLAGWLDYDLIEDWPTGVTRRNIRGAVDLYTRRGTAEGLRRYLQLYAGVAARVEEPGAQMTALFALDENVALGFNTVLAPAYAEGAILARTAALGQSHLLDAEDAGVPLFADVANRFCVQVYAAQVTEPRTLDLVTEVIEREKPAHTSYHLCLIDAQMRVGLQARIGIDTIIGGAPPPGRLEEATALGTDTVLADQPPRSGRVGHGLRVGTTL